ncbi:hypothetical protein ACSBR1_016301 [Camellia fascicularis]
MPNTTTYTPNSTYQSNLNTLFSVLASKSTTINGFYNFTAGLSPPDIAYSLFLCRGDVSTQICQDCMATATKEVVQNCLNSKVVTIWHDECMLRYSNKSIFSISDKSLQEISFLVTKFLVAKSMILVAENFARLNILVAGLVVGRY